MAWRERRPRNGSERRRLAQVLLHSEDSGAWLEIAFLLGSKEGGDHVIAMRDGSGPDGPALVLTPDE